MCVIMLQLGIRVYTHSPLVWTLSAGLLIDCRVEDTWLPVLT
jgi:hypothetical protein